MNIRTYIRNLKVSTGVHTHITHPGHPHPSSVFWMPCPPHWSPPLLKCLYRTEYTTYTDLTPNQININIHMYTYRYFELGNTYIDQFEIRTHLEVLRDSRNP